MVIQNKIKAYPRFVIRQVRNGRIKFDNQYWVPDEPTDRLNEQRFAFGVYVEHYSRSTKRLDMLSLWGSEETYTALTDEEYNTARDKEKLILSPDGYLRQTWWRPVVEAAL